MWVLSPYTLPCGLATVDLPHAWNLVEQGYNHAALSCDEGRMSIECMPYERPDVIASGNFKELFWDFLSEKYFEQYKPALAEWWADGANQKVTLSDRVETRDGALERVAWRQMAICPPHHVRQLTWRFERNLRTDAYALRDFAAELHRVVIPRTRFTVNLTVFDRVAPSPTLKMVPMGDSIFIRMPPQWKVKRENEDGTGRRLVDEPELDRWTLWFDWNQLTNDGNPPRDEDEIRPLIDDAVQLMQETQQRGTNEVKSGPGMDRIVVQHITEQGLVTTNWNRVSIVDGNLFFVQLSFNVVENRAEDPDIPAIRDLIERELINAVLVPKMKNEAADG